MSKIISNNGDIMLNRIRTLLFLMVTMQGVALIGIPKVFADDAHYENERTQEITRLKDFYAQLGKDWPFSKNFSGNLPYTDGLLGSNEHLVKTQGRDKFDAGTQRLSLALPMAALGQENPHAAMDYFKQLWPAVDALYDYQLPNGQIGTYTSQHAVAGSFASQMVFAHMDFCAGMLVMEQTPEYAEDPFFKASRSKLLPKLDRSFSGYLFSQNVDRQNLATGMPLKHPVQWLQAIDEGADNRLAIAGFTIDTCGLVVHRPDFQQTANGFIQDLLAKQAQDGAFFENHAEDLSYNMVTVGYLVQYAVLHGIKDGPIIDQIKKALHYTLDRIASDGVVYTGDSNRTGGQETTLTRNGSIIAKPPNYGEIAVFGWMTQKYLGEGVDPRWLAVSQKHQSSSVSSAVFPLFQNKH